jgi:hypothetical protein
VVKAMATTTLIFLFILVSQSQFNRPREHLQVEMRFSWTSSRGQLLEY